MTESLFAPEFQAILDQARKLSGQDRGPFPSPEDWRDQWIYFLMIDRFNNPGSPPRHRPFDDPNFSGFQGGKFSGVRQQVAYIKQLGAGAIWLSPPLKNLPFSDGSYHGYGIHDFLRAEPRFADNPVNADDELRVLVDEAHAQGLYVVFDIVLNHTGDVFVYQCDPADRLCQDARGSEASHHDGSQPVRWRDETGAPKPEFAVVERIPNPPHDALIWPRELQRNQFLRREGKPQIGGDDTLGDFDSLKQLLTEDADLQRFLIRAYQYVIARYDVDGFRIDTLRYLKGDLPRLFGNSMREFALSIGKKNFFTFGEVFDRQAEEDIARFIGRNTNDGSELIGVDAALDFPLFDVLKAVVKGFGAPTAITEMYQQRKRLEKNVLSSHGDATRYFVTFLDNHDVKERIRFVQPGDVHRFDKQVTLGLACLYSLPGIPCLYYGTEQGLHGRGSDPAVREALWGAPGFDQGSVFYREIQGLANVRAQQAALRYGRFYFRPVSGDGQTFGISPFPQGVLAFSRILNDEEVLVVANTNTSQPQSVNVIVEIQLNEVNSGHRILYSNNSAPVAPAPTREIASATINEVDGSIGHGPLHVVRVTLQPMEVQILGKQ